MKRTKLPEKYQQEIENIKNIIIKAYKPEKIILFGSAATGKINEGSDLDIFIVKKTTSSFTQRYIDVTKLFSAKKIPADFIVYTPEEFMKAQKQKRFFLEQVLNQGKILYEKTISG